ncbi:hypothetical protein QNH48_28645 [Neobacillus sp. YX16]|uniref:hypothetical protein n=1 Tax=Neobacillus sp. YX16 TaxID=3047874 RepID=UPI0024C23ED0|nr:hypothetical protein [Neobacillus sp. YX16]WHZ02842.1 hypothetical protein QNH48_28645 [Neobacillus sp. YX16]
MNQAADIIGNIYVQKSAIMNNLKEESVAVYAYITKEFNKGNITENPVFQFMYRSYYRLDHSGLMPEFKQAYFAIMEELRGSVDIDLIQIIDRLYEYPRRKGDKSVQFSFATKLANTINRSYPIYDSEVAKVFGFSKYHIKNKEQKIKRYMNQYQYLINTYNVMTNDERFMEMIKEFDRKFDGYHLPIVKKIDFIIWSAGKL